MTCFVEPIRYGDLTLSAFPLTATVKSNPVMSSNGITIKYYTSEITVDMIVSVPDTFVDGNGVSSVDSGMDTIKSRLLVRGLPLVFNYRGFGTSFFIDTTQGNELLYGPIPKILDWQPLGTNKAVRLVWTVEFRTSRCPVFPSPSSTNSEVRFQLLEFTEDISTSYGEEGELTVEVSGTIEVAGTWNPTRRALQEFVRLFIAKTDLRMFKRTVKVDYSRDLRTVNYTITDTEITSDNPYFPYMLRQEVDHSVSSELLGASWQSGIGFTTWANEMNGEFTVRPGEWKGWAWLAFALALYSRRSRAKQANNLDKFAKDIEDRPEAENQNARKRITVSQVPLSLKIKESLYSRKVNVSSSWVTRSNIADLFKATGMFSPVDAKYVGIDIGRVPAPGQAANPEGFGVQWALWKTSIAGPGGPQNTLGHGYRNVRLSNVDILFDPCSQENQVLASQNAINQFYSPGILIAEPNRVVPESSYGEGALGSGKYDGDKNSGTSYYLRGLSPEESWITYKPSLHIIEQANSAYIPTVDLEDVQTRQATSGELAATIKTADRIRFNGKVEVPQDRYEYDVVQVRGKPLYKVRLTGYALRIGWPIPFPVIRAINNRPAYRIGTNHFHTSTVGVSDEVPVYLAMWSIDYGLKGTPDSSDFRIDTSAKASEFV
jgi:hypothetical protein